MKNKKYRIALSLILAALRGFCLFIFYMLLDYLPAGRQVGKKNRSRAILYSSWSNLSAVK